MTDLLIQAKSLIKVGDKYDFIANLSNISALIYQEYNNLNWCGFYLFNHDRLVLGPFQGKIACREIEVGHGVCGTAVLKRETIRVDDVHQFKGHIACDSASNSEIVIPIIKDGIVYGVLDIDSPVLSRFNDKEQRELEDLVELIKEGIYE